MRNVLIPALAAALILSGAAAPAIPPILGADWLLDQVRALSASEMDGRASGTAGADRAARHISRIFQEAGLQPGGDGGSFLQTFPVPVGTRLGPTNALTILGRALPPLVVGQDFVPLPVSSDSEAEADVVFVGYGITAPDLGYDDYAGVDVRGKIVLAMTQEPRARDSTSPFRRPEAYHYSERRHKVINAREHGARAILLVSRPSSQKDALPALGGISQPWSIMAVAITRTVADALLGPAGQRLEHLADAIDRALAPRSFSPPGVRARLNVDVIRDRGTTANVIGVIPGRDPRLKEQAIVVGAHYDHLGRGGEGSLAPDQVGVIHPGADDNASGTAAVMALARSFAVEGGAARTIVFVAFAAEEMGLLGSTEYVRRPPVPVDKTVLMVNLDMVGRLRGKLYVGGVDSGTGLRLLVTEAADAVGLGLELRADPFAPSDHTAFYTAGMPVLFLFTGAHGDYHRPTDTWDKLNAPGLATVTRFVARVVARVAADPSPPAYVKIEASAPGSRGGGYGPVFGVVPDFAERERPGVRITGVRPGTPAERAGVQAGDVIMRFAGVEVRTLDDLTFALRRQRPGDRVEIVIERDGQEHRLHAILEERR